MHEPALADALRPLDRPVRALRSLAAAAACVLVAAGGHALAGGSLAPSAVLVVLAGSCAVAWLLSARRVSPAQMAGLLVLCQALVHLGAPTDHMAMSASMLAAHAVATVVSVVALARGEALLWDLASRLGLRKHLSVVVIGGPHLRVPAPATPQSPRRDIRLTHCRVVRGPPSGS